MTTDSARFDGLAFPVISVRLANHKGRASMSTPNGVERATLDYTYDMPDGERFAVRVATKLWERHALANDAEYQSGDTVLIPGDPGPDKGYLFVAVPARFFV